MKEKGRKWGVRGCGREGVKGGKGEHSCERVVKVLVDIFT